MLVGAKLPNSGRLAIEVGIPELAVTLEQAGFASLWVADHIVMPETIGSPYPFSPDGRATWPTDAPYVEAMVALALAAGVTTTARLGTAALVLPLRNPVDFAKQAASIDVASGGRIELGVGAGWLEEEFAALNVPFDRRGSRLAEWIAIARECWTGRPGARHSDFYDLPAGLLCLPAPGREIPLLIGGHSPLALRRAGRIGDGWLAQQPTGALSAAELQHGVASMRAASKDAGRDPDRLRVVLRIVESAGRSDEVARQLPMLAAAGVEEVIVDVDWSEGGDPARDYERLRTAV